MVQYNCNIKAGFVKEEYMAKKKLLDSAHIDVIYDEPDTTTYAGVEVRAGIWKKTFFGNGITRDFSEALAWGHMFAKLILSSSSVDQFLMDGPYIFLDGTIHPLEEVRVGLS